MIIGSSLVQYLARLVLCPNLAFSTTALRSQDLRIMMRDLHGLYNDA